ncbi:MAG: molecular chaperone DnaJ [Candidatus Hepatoplasma vulgare]|nr:MAG: molecular chaperone DnaJ [Candidatus Hepatoplasma sp.]
MNADYYDILGVEKKATQEEIKKAYRKKAMLYHPDKNKGDKKAEDKFKEVNEAYEVLSSPERRNTYDRFGKEASQQQGFNRGAHGFSGFNDFSGNFNSEDISSIFEDLMGGFGFSGFNQNAKRKGRNLNYIVKIDILDAFNGKKIKIKLSNGKIKEINIPAGIREGMIIRMTGQGKPGINGGPNGDLKVEVNITNKTPFERIKDDLYHSLELNYLSLLKAQTINFRLFTGELIKFDVPQFHDYKKLIRIKGKGFTSLNSKRGDLYIKINIKMPKKITRKGLKILDEFLSEVKY